MLKVEQVYPSDLSDQQWKAIKGMIPPARPGGRPRTTDVRGVLNAIFYVNQSGCAWRYLPHHYPRWQTVYGYYLSWQESGVLRRLHEVLVMRTRRKSARRAAPSALIVDGQSVKARWGEARGYDGFKKVQGRKRSIFVDTLGLIHGLKVTTAARGDHRVAIEMMREGHGLSPTIKGRLNVLYADAGYGAFEFRDVVKERFGVVPTLNKAKSQRVCVHNKVKNTWTYKDVVVETNLKPVRWVVERTFAWFGNYRRLCRDYEITTRSSEAMILVSMIQLMLRRLFRPKPYRRWAV